MRTLIWSNYFIHSTCLRFLFFIFEYQELRSDIETFTIRSARIDVLIHWYLIIYTRTFQYNCQLLHPMILIIKISYIWKVCKFFFVFTVIIIPKIICKRLTYELFIFLKRMKRNFYEMVNKFNRIIQCLSSKCVHTMRHLFILFLFRPL